MRKVVVLLVGCSLLVAGAWAGFQFSNGHIPLLGDTCRAYSGEHAVQLRPEQMRHAATIAAIGQQRGVSHRGVQVALATAMQESELFNLPSGDRDSIGLFQQRASQGWGKPAQLTDPRYTAAKFYERLVTIPDWEQMRITDAAQAVQRSAHPEAYERWATDADALATAFLGLEPSAVTCHLRRDSSGVAEVGQLQNDLAADWGANAVTSRSSTDGRLLTVAPAGTGSGGGNGGSADTAKGWQFAHWMVAWSRSASVAKVTYAGKVWSADTGKWKGTDDSASGEVVVELLSE